MDFLDCAVPRIDQRIAMGFRVHRVKKLICSSPHEHGFLNYECKNPTML